MRGNTDALVYQNAHCTPAKDSFLVGVLSNGTFSQTEMSESDLSCLSIRATTFEYPPFIVFEDGQVSSGYEVRHRVGKKSSLKV